MQRTAFLIVLAVMAATASAAEPARAIYRCDTPTGTVFADRPCGQSNQPYEPEGTTVSIMTTVAPKPQVSKPAPARTVRGEKSVPTSTAKADACARIDQSLRKIASTLRTGYSAAQGERLKERRRELNEKRRAQRC